MPETSVDITSTFETEFRRQLHRLELRKTNRLKACEYSVTVITFSAWSVNGFIHVPYIPLQFSPLTAADLVSAQPMTKASGLKLRYKQNVNETATP